MCSLCQVSSSLFSKLIPCLAQPPYPLSMFPWEWMKRCISPCGWGTLPVCPSALWLGSHGIGNCSPALYSVSVTMKCKCCAVKSSKTYPQAKMRSLSQRIEYFNINSYLHLYCSYREDLALQVRILPSQLAISGNQNTCWEKWKLTDLWPSGIHLLPSRQRDGTFQGAV